MVDTPRTTWVVLVYVLCIIRLKHTRTAGQPVSQHSFYMDIGCETTDTLLGVIVIVVIVVVIFNCFKIIYIS